MALGSRLSTSTTSGVSGFTCGSSQASVPGLHPTDVVRAALAGIDPEAAMACVKGGWIGLCSFGQPNLEKDRQ